MRERGEQKGTGTQSGQRQEKGYTAVWRGRRMQKRRVHWTQEEVRDKDEAVRQAGWDPQLMTRAGHGAAGHGSGQGPSLSPTLLLIP